MLSVSSLVSAALRAKLKAKREGATAKTQKPTKAIPTEAQRDPVALATQVFGLTVWSRQREILTAVRDNERVTVRSGHKVSKTTSDAVVAWWWVCDPIERPKARAIITAPTGRQVRELVWREITDLWIRATRRGYVLPKPAKAPGTGVVFGDGRQIVGFTIDEGQPEAIAGFSGEDLLFILDEASGIDDRVFEALDGNAAGGAHFLLTSNPTRTSGAFFESHQPGSEYTALHLSSEDSPNITGEATIPGLATAAWRDKMVAKYGEASLFVAVRIRGEFPSAADDEICGATLIREAMHRQAEGDGPLDLGLDVAGFGGDENILAPRRAQRVLPLVRIEAGESHEVAGRALRAIRRLRRPGEKPRVKIDANGVGFGVWSALVSDGFDFDGEHFEPCTEVEAIAVNVGESAQESDTYANLRAELHFTLRDFLRAGGSLPDDALLGEELREPKYSLDRNNRILVEPKLKVRARLGRSPDRADGVMLAVMNVSPVIPPAPPAPFPIADDRSLDAFASR